MMRNNGIIVLMIMAITIIAIIMIYNFLQLSSDKQIDKMKEWLLYAVVIAEKELGEGTGSIKLRYVYDMFLSRFPKLAKIMTFLEFSMYVDVALDKMKIILDNNNRVRKLVGTERKGNNE